MKELKPKELPSSCGECRFANWVPGVPIACALDRGVDPICEDELPDKCPLALAETRAKVMV